MCMSSYNHRRLTVLTTHIGRYLTKLLDNVGAVGSLCSTQRGSQSSHGHRWLAIFARGQHKELLELPLQRLKRWPLHLVLGPALQHDLVEGARAAGWTRHPIAVLHLVQNLRVGHPCQHIETVHQLSKPVVVYRLTSEIHLSKRSEGLATNHSYAPPGAEPPRWSSLPAQRNSTPAQWTHSREIIA